MIGVIVLLALLLAIGALIYNFVSNRPPASPQLPTDLSEPQSSTAPASEASQSAQSPDNSQSQAAPSSSVQGQLRTVYMPIATAIDPAKRDAFLAKLAGTNVTAVMIDVKDDTGTVLYKSKTQQAAQWETVAENALDLKVFADILRGQNLSLVARMSVFRDERAAFADRTNAIHYQQTDMMWLDNSAEQGGKPWLNPYAKGTQAYILSLVREVADAGASMLVLSDYHFPAFSETNATFGSESNNISRTQLLQSFLKEIHNALEQKNVRVAPYINSLTLMQQTENMARYGNASPFAIQADTFLIGAFPYDFGGNYTQGEFSVQKPMQHPDQLVTAILNFIPSTLPENTTAPTIIPVLQGGREAAFNKDVTYTQQQITAQINVLTQRKQPEYFFYHSAGEYTLPPK